MDYFVLFCLFRFHRYEDENSLGNEAIFLNAGKKPDDCKMVARAIFSFQAQNNRELSFKKGDVIYIKKQVGLKPVYGDYVGFQVDSNWYEGERNAMLGIFPTTYVEIIPQDAVASQVQLEPFKDCLSHVLKNL